MRTMKCKTISLLLLLSMALTFLLTACGKEAPPEFPGATEIPYTVADLTINISGEAKKVLRLTAVLWLKTDALVATLDAKVDIVKDHIIHIGRGKTFEELQDVDIQSVISAEITATINEAFATEEVSFVTLPQFFYN